MNINNIIKNFIKKRQKENLYFCKINSYSGDNEYIIYKLKNNKLSYWYLTSLKNLINILLNEKYINYNELLKKYNQEFTITEFKKILNNTIPIVCEWVDDLTADPTYKQITFFKELEDKYYFNLFVYPKVYSLEKQENINKTHFQTIHKLIFNLCGNNEIAYNWLIEWIALAIQKPTMKTTNAVIIAGYFGSGKNEFVNILNQLFENTVQIINADVLSNRFNDYFEGKLFIIGDEIAYSNKSDKFYIANKLKPLISNQDIQIEEKNKPIRNSKNFTRFIIFSNDKNVIPIDTGDRRYLVLNPANTLFKSKEQNTFGIFDIKQYNTWKKTEFEKECELFGKYLINYKCDPLSLYKEPPLTYEKKQIITLNTSNFKIVIEECIKNLYNEIKNYDSKYYLNLIKLYNEYKMVFNITENEYLSIEKFIAKLSIYLNIEIDKNNINLSNIKHIIIPENMMLELIKNIE